MKLEDLKGLKYLNYQNKTGLLQNTEKLFCDINLLVKTKKRS